MIRKFLSFSISAMFILSLFINPINSEAAELNSEKIFFEQLSSEELNAYKDSLNKVTEDPDFTVININKIINMDSMTFGNNQNVELIDSKYTVTSILNENKGNVKNYNAYIFAKETFKFNEDNNIKPFASSSDDGYDYTGSVYYFIKLNYNKTNSPYVGMSPISSEFKVVSTNSGVRVTKANVVQKAWGNAFNINGTNLGIKHYNRSIDIYSPATGRNYIHSFNNPSSTYFRQDTPVGQCGFGVIITMKRPSGNSWEYSTSFLGMDNGVPWP